MLVGGLIAGSLAVLLALGTIGRIGSADPAVASEAAGGPERAAVAPTGPFRCRYRSRRRIPRPPIPSTSRS